MASLVANSWYGGIVDTFNRAVDNVSSRLMNSTSISSSASPFSDFGVTAAAQRARHTVSPAREHSFFSVEEARERIASYIDRTFVPESITELVSYLSERFLKLEARPHTNGNYSNVLVDTKSKRSVPAAQVDPSLSRENVLLFQLKSTLREQLGRDENSRIADPRDAFSSWEAMRFDMDNSSSKARYTVSNGVGWYGVQYAEATGDPKEDRKIVMAAREKGIDLVLPRAPSQPGKPASLVPGLPILIKQQSMKAASIDSRLDHDVLAKAFKDSARRTAEGRGVEWSEDNYGPSGLVDRWLSKGSAGLAFPGSPVAETKVVSMDAWKFKAMHLKKASPEPEVEQAQDMGGSFGGLYDGDDKRDLVLLRDENANGGWIVYDRDLKEELYIGMNSLPEGSYPKLDQDGNEVGRFTVSSDGHEMHIGRDGKPERVNSSRPEEVSPRMSM